MASERENGTVNFNAKNKWKSSRKLVKKNDLNDQVKEKTLKILDKWKAFCADRRKEKGRAEARRKGPAPIEDYSLSNLSCKRNKVSKPTYGTLDSDVEDLDIEGGLSRRKCKVKCPGKKLDQGDRSLASCKALIIYFANVAKSKDDDEKLDLKFVSSLLQNGADINFGDRHGQTMIHEVARGWHTDVMKFAILHGADLNKADHFGRTPLHLASAMNYAEMVEFLIQNEADINAATKDERQTAMHYAAKNDATSSLKMLMKLGASVNDRDYKMRTPLFVAAETARSEAARYLIEQDAPVGVYDDKGTPCLSLMIEKMPDIALEAIEQFHKVSLAFRKHYYYLNYMEKDRKFLEPESKPKNKKSDNGIELEPMIEVMKGEKKEKSFGKTPLEVIVEYNQLDLVMHPVFQRLLIVKWNLFGRWGALLSISTNLIYTLIWTALAVFIPRDGNYYSPPSEKWWRITLEVIGVLMTFYFIFTEIRQMVQTERGYNRWRQWRARQLERDLQFCHPRWPDERNYLESELRQLRSFQRTYFRQPWNIFEWVTYVVILVLMGTRIISAVMGNEFVEMVHTRVYTLSVLILWLRILRPCRAFRSLGPFIAILGSVVGDTLKFFFLLFEFYVPFTIGFFITFGGKENSQLMGVHSTDWKNINDIMFSLWQMTLIGNFNWHGLVRVDRLMAQVMVALYLVTTSVVCLNLYIALLSDTFSRIYSRAQANAALLQAQVILTVENSLPKEQKLKYAHYMQNECGPLDISILDEGDLPDDQENLMFQRVVRQISNRIGELEDYLQQLFLKRPQNQQPQVDQPEDERKNEKKKTKKCMRALEYNSSDNNLTDNQEFRHASSTVVREITTRLEDHKKEIKQDLNGMKKLILKLMKAVAKEPEAEVSGKGETDDNQDNDYEGDGNEDSECSSSQTVEISQKKSLIRRRSEKPKQGTPRKQSKQESPGRKKKEDKPK